MKQEQAEVLLCSVKRFFTFMYRGGGGLRVGYQANAIFSIFAFVTWHFIVFTFQWIFLYIAVVVLGSFFIVAVAIDPQS